MENNGFWLCIALHNQIMCNAIETALTYTFDFSLSCCSLALFPFIFAYTAQRFVAAFSSGYQEKLSRKKY